MSHPESMTEWNGFDYWKEQDFQTSARLYLQDWIWNKQLLYNLHPGIQRQQGLQRVADVACGNGAWIMNVAQERPDIEIDGFDITQAHFPQTAWLPPNIKFHHWDARLEPGAEHVGQYDIVHVRSILSIIVDNNVTPILSNVLKLLKPGGYLQWDETDVNKMTIKVPQGVDAPSTKTLAALMRSFGKASKMSTEWLDDLAPTLQSEGCVVVADETLDQKPELSKAWTDNMLTVWRQTASLLPEQSIPLPPADDHPPSIDRAAYVRFVMAAGEEARKGAWPATPYRVIVAQKT